MSEIYPLTLDMNSVDLEIGEDWVNSTYNVRGTVKRGVDELAAASIAGFYDCRGQQNDTIRYLTSIGLNLGDEAGDRIRSYGTEAFVSEVVEQLYREETGILSRTRNLLSGDSTSINGVPVELACKILEAGIEQGWEKEI